MVPDINWYFYFHLIRTSMDLLAGDSESSCQLCFFWKLQTYCVSISYFSSWLVINMASLPFIWTKTCGSPEGCALPTGLWPSPFHTQNIWREITVVNVIITVYFLNYFILMSSDFDINICRRRFRFQVLPKLLRFFMSNFWNWKSTLFNTFLIPFIGSRRSAFWVFLLSLTFSLVTSEVHEFKLLKKLTLSIMSSQ